MGDVGDFGKYGLLRALCAEELTIGSRTYDLSLGVVWYLVPDEGNPGDGGHVGWMRQEPRYMPCDPELFHILLRMIRDGDRSVRAVRERGVRRPRARRGRPPRAGGRRQGLRRGQHPTGQRREAPLGALGRRGFLRVREAAVYPHHLGR